MVHFYSFFYMQKAVIFHSEISPSEGAGNVNKIH